VRTSVEAKRRYTVDLGCHRAALQSLFIRLARPPHCPAQRGEDGEQRGEQQDTSYANREHLSVK